MIYQSLGHFRLSQINYRRGLSGEEIMIFMVNMNSPEKSNKQIEGHIS